MLQCLGVYQPQHSLTIPLVEDLFTSADSGLPWKDNRAGNLSFALLEVMPFDVRVFLQDCEQWIA